MRNVNHPSVWPTRDFLHAVVVPLHSETAPLMPCHRPSGPVDRQGENRRGVESVRGPHSRRKEPGVIWVATVVVAVALNMLINMLYARAWRRQGWRAACTELIRQVGLTDPSGWQADGQERATRLAILVRSSGYGSQTGRRVQRKSSADRLLVVSRRISGIRIQFRHRAIVSARSGAWALQSPTGRRINVLLRGRRSDPGRTGEGGGVGPIGRVPRPAGERVPSGEKGRSTPR